MTRMLRHSLDIFHSFNEPRALTGMFSFATNGDDLLFSGSFSAFSLFTIILGWYANYWDGWNLWIKVKEKVESHQSVTQPNNNVIHSQLMKNRKKLEWSGSLRSHKGGHQTLKVKPCCQDMYRVIWANHEMSLYWNSCFFILRGGMSARND